MSGSIDSISPCNLEIKQINRMPENESEISKEQYGDSVLLDFVNRPLSK